MSAIKSYLDSTEILDHNGDEVTDYSECLLACVQTINRTLPNGVSYTFDGDDKPNGFPFTYVSDAMFKAATRGELELGGRNDAWANTPNDLRNRRQTKMTLDPSTLANIDALATQWGCPRSRAVDRIVAWALERGIVGATGRGMPDA